MLSVARLPYDVAAFAPLLAEAAAHDGGFMARLHASWIDGSERYGRPGETLLGLWDGQRMVGAGGVSIDPYTVDPAFGRVRHVYVARDYRRRGGGDLLVRSLVAHGRRHFASLRLRTDNPAAARLYERLGFIAADAADETHRLTFEDVMAG